MKEKKELSPKKISVSDRRIIRVEKNFAKHARKSEKDLEDLSCSIMASLEHIDIRFKAICDKIELWEESLMLIYHNIKKNQFLYAHYPDEWVRTYLDAKKALIQENKDLGCKTKKDLPR